MSKSSFGRFSSTFFKIKLTKVRVPYEEALKTELKDSGAEGCNGLSSAVQKWKKKQRGVKSERKQRPERLQTVGLNSKNPPKMNCEIACDSLTHFE